MSMIEAQILGRERKLQNISKPSDVTIKLLENFWAFQKQVILNESTHMFLAEDGALAVEVLACAAAGCIPFLLLAFAASRSGGDGTS